MPHLPSLTEKSEPRAFYIVVVCGGSPIIAWPAAEEDEGAAIEVRVSNDIASACSSVATKRLTPLGDSMDLRI